MGGWGGCVLEHIAICKLELDKFNEPSVTTRKVHREKTCVHMNTVRTGLSRRGGVGLGEPSVNYTNEDLSLSSVQLHLPSPGQCAQAGEQALHAVS
ncbi:hypothetical protein ElyMa_003765700 [Elysia marginata]|uniref:Uncharacterized protein n=1 Tax=Elysia marginata TaxID=1093978 RepID=A0AAV4F969_9GAST|nr:hypothetical protein ElyMa_003765700 [Elysia marginata]